MGPVRAELVMGLGLLGAIASGCGRTGAPWQHATESIDLPRSMTALSSFPVSVLDSFLVAWFGAALHAMDERPMYGGRVTKGTTVLRFLWLRSFHPQVSIRVQYGSRWCTRTTIRLGLPTVEGASDANPEHLASAIRFGPIQSRDSAPLSARECAALRRQLDAAGIVTAPAADTTRGLDGAEWVFEALDSTGYHVVVRWSPDASRASGFWIAGKTFLQLGRALPPAAEIY